MRVYTAETPGGDIYVLHGEYGGLSAYGTKRDREAFAEMALAFLRTHPEDENTARELTLYEWADEKTAGTWLRGGVSTSRFPAAPRDWAPNWGEMARQAEFGQITYEYPGDWVIQI